MSQVIDRCHNTAESHKNTKYLNVEPSHDQGYRLSRELRAASYLNHHSSAKKKQIALPIIFVQERYFLYTSLIVREKQVLCPVDR